MDELNKAIEFYNHGDFQEAEQRANFAISQGEKSSNAYATLARIQTQLGKYSDALKNFQFAKELDATDEYLNIHIADMYNLMGNQEKAKEIWRNLIIHSQDRPNVLLSSARLAQKEGRCRESIDFCEEYMNVTGGLFSMPGCYVSSLLELKEYEKAWGVIRFRLATPFNRANNLYYMGVCEEGRKNRKSAIRAYEECLALEPNRMACLQRLCRLKLRTWQFRSAAALFKKMLDVTRPAY